MDHYSVLGIGMAATAEEIELAYRLSVQRLEHGPSWRRLLMWLLGITLARLQEARDVLLDAQQREKYDQRLACVAAYYARPPQ